MKEALKYVTMTGNRKSKKDIERQSLCKCLAGRDKRNAKNKRTRAKNNPYPEQQETRSCRQL